MKGIAIFLCDVTGIMAEPWARAGYHCILVDPQHPEGAHADGLITRVGHVIDHPVTWRVLRTAITTGKVVFVAGFPPCTDLAVSGSRWLKAKRIADPSFQFKAMHVVWQCQIIGQLSGAPWLAENPVSQISSLWRKPDFLFNPYEFTSLCGDDNYFKKTCIWSGGGMMVPEKRMLPEIEAVMAKVAERLGRCPLSLKEYREKLADIWEECEEWYPSDKIHKCAPGPERANIRSATPYGFAEAVFRANAPHAIQLQIPEVA